MLITRIVSALVLIPLVAAAVWLGGAWLAGLAAIFAVLAVIEFYQLSRRLGARPSVPLGAALAAALVLSALFPGYGIGPAAFAVALAGFMVARVLRQDLGGFLTDWAVTLVGSAYVGGLLGYYVLLRNLSQGLAWVVLALLVTWISDTAAYFVGSSIGRRPFFRRVSPRKTLEGAVGGVLIGTLAAMVIGALALRLSWLEGAGLGLLLTLATTFGDLAESLIKRQAGVKDSGRLIPGHGGALDRVDSVLFAGVTVYYFAVLIGRAP